MHICNRCILPSTFPGITFDNEGICNFCRDFKGEVALNEKKLNTTQNVKSGIKSPEIDINQRI